MMRIAHANKIKTAAAALAAALLMCALGLVGCSGQSASSASSSSASVDNGVGVHHATLEVEGYDPITIELDGDAAPKSVENFMTLAKDGYYDGKTFYRIVDDFCLQGGTLGNSASGNDPSLESIKGEFSTNGVDNPLADSFDRGVVAMARTTMPDSATSTFFVTLGNASQVGASLDGQYAAFGTIDDAGMKVIDQIVTDFLPNVDDPNMGAISDEAKQPIIKSITITD